MFPFERYEIFTGSIPLTNHRVLLFKFFSRDTHRFSFARNRIGIGSLYSPRNFFAVHNSFSISRHPRRSMAIGGKLCFDNFSSQTSRPSLVRNKAEEISVGDSTKRLKKGRKGRRKGRDIRFCGLSLAALTSKHDSIRKFSSFVDLYVDLSRRLIGRIR